MEDRVIVEDPLNFLDLMSYFLNDFDPFDVFFDWLLNFLLFLKEKQESGYTGKENKEIWARDCFSRVSLKITLAKEWFLKGITKPNKIFCRETLKNQLGLIIRQDNYPYTTDLEIWN